MDLFGAFPRVAGLVALLVGMFFVALIALVWPADRWWRGEGYSRILVEAGILKLAWICFALFRVSRVWSRYWWACFSSHSTHWFDLRTVGGEGSVFADLGRSMNLEIGVDLFRAFPRVAGLVALLVVS